MDHPIPPPNETEISLNGTKVNILAAHPSGHHIKSSGIEQGVPIEIGWALMEVTAEGERRVADEDHVHLREGAAFVAHPHETEISVNERPVLVPGHEATGMGIKEAAIRQAVPIQPDFVLSEELEHRRTRVIGDDELLHLHPRMRFVAVAPDDNS